MKNWTEIRTAAEVARLGTISAAAQTLGIHRATVTRHIDALEAGLKSKLFQRHKRGFTPTELGLDLLRVAETTADQFSELERKAQGSASDLSGDLIVTSLDEMTMPLLPVLSAFQERHRNVTLRYICSETALKLEYGEAHVAFRLGAEPQDPDNVVRPYRRMPIGLYASANYIAKHGKPNAPAEFSKHRFVGSDNPNTRAPYQKWLLENVPLEVVKFRSNHVKTLHDAVLQGIGIGFVLQHVALSQPNMIEILAPRKEWDVVSWVVTHVDLHRTAKVQAFLKMLKEIQGSQV